MSVWYRSEQPEAEAARMAKPKWSLDSLRKGEAHPVSTAVPYKGSFRGCSARYMHSYPAGIADLLSLHVFGPRKASQCEFSTNLRGK
jgi:hypothetical protein